MKNSMPVVPSSHWLLKNFNKLASDPLNFMTYCNEQYGDMVEMNITPWVDVVLVTDPDMVKAILVDNHRSFKKSFVYRFLKYALGNGLLTNEGESWLQQRRIAQPAFHREKLAALAEGMAGTVEKMLNDWESHYNAQHSVDVAAEFMRLTTEVASQAMFSTELGDIKKEITENIDVVNHFLMTTISSPFRIPLWVPTGANLRFKASLKKLDKIIFQLIETRRKSKAFHYDLLTLLMEAEDEESGEKMNNKQLRDELMTLFLAGSETSSNALAWTTYLLAKHPEIKSEMSQEIARELGNQRPTAENVLKLKYTSMVIQEAMRLYPPAWIIGRQPLSKTRLKDMRIKKRTQLYISPYVIHRSPKIWPDPEKFDPLRFLPENSKMRHKFSYFPFGAGPRLCIGNNFAMMEMTITLAMIAQRGIQFKLDQENIDLEPLITLRPKGGMKMKISKE